MTDISVLSITDTQFIILIIIHFATLFTILLVHLWIFERLQHKITDIKKMSDDKNNEIYKDSMKYLKEIYRNHEKK